MDLCVDIAWVQKGGLDPAEFLRQHKDRISYLHLKDYNEEGWTELGSGVVNISGVMQRAARIPAYPLGNGRAGHDPA